MFGVRKQRMRDKQENRQGNKEAMKGTFMISKTPVNN